MATFVSFQQFKRSIHCAENASFPNQAQDQLKTLQELQKNCGVEFGQYQSSFTDEQLRYISYARAQCVDILSQSGHFIEVKESALDLLILLLKNDPYANELTANGLIELLKALKEKLQNIEEQIPRLQAKFFQAYVSALDNVICHYYTYSLKALPESLKQELKSFPQLAKKLNSRDKERLDPSFEYYAEYALIAPTYLQTEKTKEAKFLEGLVNFIKTCHSAYSLDFANLWKNFQTTIKDMEFGKKWHLGLLLEKELFTHALKEPISLTILQEFIQEWGLSKSLGGSYATDWKFLYGSIEHLVEIVIQSDNPQIQEIALLGTQHPSQQSISLLDFVSFNAFKFNKENNWKVRYGAVQGLLQIWHHSNNVSIRNQVATILRQCLGTEKDERILQLIKQQKDSTLIRVWNGELLEEIEQAKKEKQKLEQQQQQFSSQEQEVHQDKQLLEQVTKEQQKVQAELKKREQGVSSYQQQIHTLEQELQALKKAEQTSSRLTKEQEELLEQKELELQMKQQQLEKASSWLQRKEQAAQQLQAKLQVEQAEFTKKQQQLEQRQAQILQQEVQLKEQLLALKQQREQIEQMTQDEALARVVQEAEFFQASTKAKKLEEIPFEKGSMETAKPVLSPEKMDELLCPISAEPMYDAVTVPSGQTYSRTAIEKWLEEHTKDPLTNTFLTKKDLVEARIVQGLVARTFGAPSPQLSLNYYSRTGENAFYIRPESKKPLQSPEHFVHQAFLKAAKLGQLSELLSHLKQGAYIDTVDKQGNTALHLAMGQKNEAILLALVNNHIELLIENQQGQTALEVGFRKTNREGITTVLQKLSQEELKEFYTEQLDKGKAKFVAFLQQIRSSSKQLLSKQEQIITPTTADSPPRMPSPKPTAQSSSASVVRQATSPAPVSKPLQVVALPQAGESLPSLAFGKAKWEQYFGEVGVEPPLPKDIAKILESPCPIWSGKKVKETHLLTLIPKTVNGQPLTLELMGQLVQKPKQGYATKYRYFYPYDHEKTPLEQSHWVLMTRDVLPDSRKKSYTDKLKLVQSLNQRSKVEHEAPRLLDATVCIFVEYVQSGKRLYPDNPRTYMHCQEKGPYGQMVVGGFSAAGLDFNASNDYVLNYDVGIAVFRKFS